MLETVILDDIRTDGGTQPREYLNELVLSEYAESMAEGTEFPPVVLFFDGDYYWLADGFHRFFAAKKCGAHDLVADVRQGARRDARLYAVGANAAHGLRRTNADKRRAALTLLQDEEWQRWSNREIARQCGVTHTFVAKLRRELLEALPTPGPRLRTPWATRFSRPRRRSAATCMINWRLKRPPLLWIAWRTSIRTLLTATQCGSRPLAIPPPTPRPASRPARRQRRCPTAN